MRILKLNEAVKLLALFRSRWWSQLKSTQYLAVEKCWKISPKHSYITRYNVCIAILKFNNRWNIKKGHLIFIAAGRLGRLGRGRPGEGGRSAGCGPAAINCSVMNAVLASIKTPALYDRGGFMPPLPLASRGNLNTASRRPALAVSGVATHKMH